MTSIGMWELQERATAKVAATPIGSRPGSEQKLMLASGERPQGPTTNMEEVTHWTFVYNDFPLIAPEGTSSAKEEEEEELEVYSYKVQGRTDTGELDDVEIFDSEFLGNLPVEDPPNLTLAEAYKILCEHRQQVEPFQWASLRYPTAADGPHYNFLYDEQGHSGWGVNVETHQVVNW